jgi:hypothetical protein
MKVMNGTLLGLGMSLASAATMAAMNCEPVRLAAAPVPAWSEFSFFIVGTIISLTAYRFLRKRR